MKKIIFFMLLFFNILPAIKHNKLTFAGPFAVLADEGYGDECECGEGEEEEEEGEDGGYGSDGDSGSGDYGDGDSGYGDSGYGDYGDSGYGDYGYGDYGDSGYGDYGFGGYGDSGYGDYGFGGYGDSGYGDYGFGGYGDSGYGDYGFGGYADSGYSDSGFGGYADSGYSDYGFGGYADSGYSDYGFGGYSDSGYGDYGLGGYGDSGYGGINYPHPSYTGNEKLEYIDESGIMYASASWSGETVYYAISPAPGAEKLSTDSLSFTANFSAGVDSLTGGGMNFIANYSAGVDSLTRDSSAITQMLMSLRNANLALVSNLGDGSSSIGGLQPTTYSGTSNGGGNFYNSTVSFCNGCPPPGLGAGITAGGIITGGLTYAGTVALAGTGTVVGAPASYVVAGGIVIGAVIGGGIVWFRDHIRNSQSTEPGVIYERRDKSGNIPDPYYGQAKSDERYKARQQEHNRANPNSDFGFKVVDRGTPGKDLNQKEQAKIDSAGGPKNKSNPNGGTSNKKNVIKKPKCPPKK